MCTRTEWNNFWTGSRDRALEWKETSPPIVCTYAHLLGVCVCMHVYCTCVCVCVRERERVFAKAEPRIVISSWKASERGALGLEKAHSNRIQTASNITKTTTQASANSLNVNPFSFPLWLPWWLQTKIRWDSFSRFRSSEEGTTPDHCAPAHLPPRLYLSRGHNLFLCSLFLHQAISFPGHLGCLCDNKACVSSGNQSQQCARTMTDGSSINAVTTLPPA